MVLKLKLLCCFNDISGVDGIEAEVVMIFQVSALLKLNLLHCF